MSNQIREVGKFRRPNLLAHNKNRIVETKFNSETDVMLVIWAIRWGKSAS
jgi:hypothetical protein